MPREYTAWFGYGVILSATTALVCLAYGEFLAAAVAGAVLALLLIWYVPVWQVRNYSYEEENQRLDAVNNLRKTILQMVGGVFLLAGLWINAWQVQEERQAHRETLRTNRTADSTRLEADKEAAKEKLVTEQFIKAMQLLKDTSNITARLGGIFALERIAKESQKDHWTIMEILTGYVRDKRTRVPDSVLPPIPSDIQAMLTVIGRRKWPDSADQRINLAGTDLEGALLAKAKLDRADLRETHLDSAYLDSAYLRGAYLYGAYLEGADLEGADLGGADLREAYLDRADLRGADLRGANLEGADLKRADLKRANLEGVDLGVTDLEGAYLRGAYLREAYLEGADLKRASLEGADLNRAYLVGADLNSAYLGRADLYGVELRGADLRGADLRGANLSRADLGSANLSRADLYGVELRGADLEGAYLGRADLRGANYLTTKQLFSARTLHKAKFSDSLRTEMIRADSTKYAKLIAEPDWLE